MDDRHETESVESVVNALIAAENKLDVDSAVALFTSDAVVTLSTGVLAMTADIRGWQTGLANGHFHAEIGALKVDGDRVSFGGTVGFDPFRGMGLDAVGSLWELTVEGGKIKTFTYQFTPDAQASIQAAAAGGGVTPER
jgi:hypothetical protein